VEDNQFNDLLNDSIDFLEQIITFPSLGGEEEEVIQFMYKKFLPLADEVELVPLSDELLNDPEYSSPIQNIKYDGRHYLRIRLKGNGSGKSVVFNAHADVVPPSAKNKDQFSPYRQNGAVYGRGASDDKGQIAVLYLLLRIIKEEKLETHHCGGGQIENASSLLPAFNLYINSSIKEGLSYTILEAMQAKIPIIVTDAGGNPEIIEDGINGLVAKKKNIDDIANKIIYLLQNKDKADLFTLNSQSDQYPQITRIMIEKTFNIYKSLTQK